MAESLFSTPERKRAPLTSPPALEGRRSKRALAAELSDAVQQGDADEVLALLQLSYPNRPSVFQALSTGCVATVENILATGADPNATCDGISAISACIVAATRPLPLFQTVPRLPPFAGPTAAALVRALLVAGAKPTAYDLQNACCADTAELGKLLLAFRCPLRDAVCDYSPSHVLAACEHCPDLIYPLLEAGAEMPEAVPPTIDRGVFREAYWKQVRMLYLLFQRNSVAVQKDVLSRIAAYLAEPIQVECRKDWSVTPLAMPPLPLTSFLNPPLLC
jgi:hypothetical protein